MIWLLRVLILAIAFVFLVLLMIVNGDFDE